MMSMGRGQSLQSVRQKIGNELEGRAFHFKMDDYTNESIERFCRELAEKNTDEHIKDGMDHLLGNNCALSQEKIDASQFNDFDAVESGFASVSSVTESMTSDSGSVTSCSMQSGVNEEDSSSMKSFTLKSRTFQENPNTSENCFQNKNPTSRLAAQWPVPQTTSELKAENEFRMQTIGRGKRLEMVSAKSASITKANPQWEIMQVCDPSYRNDRIERYLDEVIKKNEMAE